ncbi:unnamed protein product [Symbiodinium natans]|uniref:Uncharacterized protein n=1 Tax=Symbiodinium natans TaxID=878477 RepID=A0A812K7Z1_9DINO|nr:unnamed protein product [Symbiodinium natans]
MQDVVRTPVSSQDKSPTSSERRASERSVRFLMETANETASRRASATSALSRDTENMQVSAMEWRDECNLLKQQLEAQERRFRFRLGGTALVLLTILAVSVVGEEHNIHGLQEKERRLTALVHVLEEQLLNISNFSSQNITTMLE